MYLSRESRDRVRSLGVDGDFPLVSVHRHPDGLLDHLHRPPQAGADTGLESIPLLDSRVDERCSRCFEAPSWRPFERAVTEVQALDRIVRGIETLEANVLRSGPLYGPLRPHLLGDVLHELDKKVAWELQTLGFSPHWEFSSPAAAVLTPRVDDLRSRAASLLRSPAGRAAVNAALATEQMVLRSPDLSLFVDVPGLSGIHLAAAVAFGTEYVPGRLLVRGSPFAVGALGQVAVSGGVYADGLSDEVLSTAMVLWDPEVSGQMGIASEALRAAVLLLSTSSSS